MQTVKCLLAGVLCAINITAYAFGSDMKMEPAPKETVKGWNVTPMKMAAPGGCTCDPCICNPEDCVCLNCGLGCKGRGRGGASSDGAEMVAMLNAGLYNVGAINTVVPEITTPVTNSVQQYMMVPQTTYETRCFIVNGMQQCRQVPVTSYVQVPVPQTTEVAQAPTPQPNFSKPATPALADQKTICPCCGMEMTAEQAAKAKVALAAAIAAAVQNRQTAAGTTTTVGTPVYTTGTPVYTSGTTVYGSTMYGGNCTTCGTNGLVGGFFGNDTYYGNGDNYGNGGGGRRGLFRRGGRRGGGGCCSG